MACRHHCVENVLGQYYSLQTTHDTLGPATGRIGAHKSLFRFVNVETVRAHKCGQLTRIN